MQKDNRVTSGLHLQGIANLSLLRWTCRALFAHAWPMTETAWEAVGRIVKARRERLGLDQDDLRLYGGPGVSTVGKCERAAQGRFSLRTQHQLENALGWRCSAIEEIISAVETNDWYADPDQRKDFENDLVNASIPDLSHPTEPEAPVLSAQHLSDSDLLAELTYRMKRYASQDDTLT